MLLTLLLICHPSFVAHFCTHTTHAHDAHICTPARPTWRCEASNVESVSPSIRSMRIAHISRSLAVITLCRAVRAVLCERVAYVKRHPTNDSCSCCCCCSVCLCLLRVFLTLTLSRPIERPIDLFITNQRDTERSSRRRQLPAADPNPHR